MDAYTQIKILGKGAFGSAWLVQRRADKLQFVAKEVRLANMKPPDREAAKHEIAMLRKLDHANITRYVDHFESRGSLYIVMEYANGGDLYTKIKGRAGRRFTEKEILHYFSQICLAIMHLHDKKILHRDLKTQNVFLTQDGIVKLGDFGISTVLRNTFEQKRTVCGTPYYFSPELCMNKPYNNKSDVWALGCILYELTTLTHAFDGNSMKALVQRILKGVYPPIHNSYSPDLAKLIASMLKLDPHQRPNIQEIIGGKLVREHLEGLRSDVAQANVERRAVVSPSDVLRERQEAMARMKAEEAMKRERQAQQEALAKEQAKEREAARAQRLVELQRQMDQRAREHQEQVRRLNEQQAQRAAQEAEKKKALEARMREARKVQAERAERQAKLNRQREEEWERNNANAAEEKRRQHIEEQRIMYGGGGGGGGYGGGGGDTPPPRRQAPPAANPTNAAFDMDAHRRAFQEMRAAALANRQRAENDRAGGPPPPVQRDPIVPAERERDYPQRAAPSAAPPQQQQRRKEENDAQARTDAYWQMRREAEANRRRLMGLDEEPPAAAAPPAAEVPAAPQQKGPSPPPTPKEGAAEDDVTTDDDEDVGYHKFLNNEAAAAGGDDEAAAKGRNKDYSGVTNAIDAALHAVSVHKPHEDFGDVEEHDPTRFVMDGQTLHLPNCEAGHPLMNRIESLRLFLEHSLGEDIFIRVYRIMDNVSSDGDEDSMRMVEAVLPPAQHKFIPVITQLIVCEEYFNEMGTS